MGIEAIRAREAAHFLPVVKPAARRDRRGPRLARARRRRPRVRRPHRRLGRLLHRPLPPGARRRDPRAGGAAHADDEPLLHAAAARADRAARRALRRGAHAHVFVELRRRGDGGRAQARAPRHRPHGFVSTENSFHGRTLGALQVIGQAKHREPYAALLRDRPSCRSAISTPRERAIDESTAAFIVEPVQGEGGVNVPPPGLPRRLRELCRRARRAADPRRDPDRHRPHRATGSPASTTASAPDIMTLGKGLGGGFPVAAFLAPRRSRRP